MTGLLADGVRLPLVLGHAGVDVLDDIRADGGAEDLGEDLGGAGGLAIGADNGDSRSGGHLVQVSGQVFSAAAEVRNQQSKIYEVFPRRSFRGFNEGGISTRAGVAYLDVGRVVEDARN